MTLNAGSFTLKEIMSQPLVWSKAVESFQLNLDKLKALLVTDRFDSVLLTGCGSTYYLALSGAALIQQVTGISAQAYPASEIALFPNRVFLPKKKYLLVAISRSGETTETLSALRVFREQTNSSVVAITCASQSSLGLAADLTLAIDAAQEESIAQTRSFTCMLIVVEAFAAFLANSQDLDKLSLLGTVIADVLDNYHPLARQLGENPRIERFFFLGSGTLYGIANEAMLKMKEMSLSYSEAYHVLEFRHGPMSMVDDGSLVIGLLSEESLPQELGVLREMRQRGAKVLAISESDSLDSDNDTYTIRLTTGLPPWARVVVYLPVLQLMAYYHALSRNQNPDQPANLEFVISLNDLM